MPGLADCSVLPTNTTRAEALALVPNVPTRVTFCETPADDSLFLVATGNFPAGTVLRVTAEFRPDAEDVDLFAGAADGLREVEPTAECAGLANEDCVGTLPTSLTQLFVELVNHGSGTREAFVLTLTVP
jgi:hypothetical protein